MWSYMVRFSTDINLMGKVMFMKGTLGNTDLEGIV